MFTNKFSNKIQQLKRAFDQRVLWFGREFTIGGHKNYKLIKNFQDYTFYTVCWNIISNVSGYPSLGYIDLSCLIPVVKYDSNICKEDEELVYLQEYLCNQLAQTPLEERAELQSSMFQLEPMFDFIKVQPQEISTK